MGREDTDVTRPSCLKQLLLKALETRRMLKISGLRSAVDSRVIPGYNTMMW